MQNTETINLDKKQLRSLINDNVKSAELLNLVYVNDKEEGINRVTKKDHFIYKINNTQIHDKEVLARIKSLVLPPAWQQVWICTSPNGHLQATGVDADGRKQYRYHPLWTALRKQTKFLHLFDLGANLPKIRSQIKSDLALKGLGPRKVLAAAVSLMEYTGIRVGNSFYEKLYGSFGLTTLKDKHITITGEKIVFSFKGKKGIYQNITLKNKKLARIVQQCKDIPGKELFQYYDEDGKRRTIDSGMVNDYIKEICGKNFTAKDLRTWTGTVSALETLVQFGCCDTVAKANHNIIDALDITAKRLGNTRTVCKKYYVHPAVLECYLNNTLEKYMAQVSNSSTENEAFCHEEQVLMKILGGANTTTIELRGNA